MRDITAAILVLAGAVLGAAGIIAETFRPELQFFSTNKGYQYGVPIALIGIGMLGYKLYSRAVIKIKERLDAYEQNQSPDQTAGKINQT